MKFFIFLICFLFSVNVWARDLIINTQSGTHIFKTDIANTPILQERGLMFKKNIPSDYAMTFLFEKPKIIRMWMKNTFIPLDMIFFDEQGIIIKIKENTIPHDLTHISSESLALGVIEVNAGIVLQKNIQLGDKVILR